MQEEYESERAVTGVEAAEILQLVARGVTAGAVTLGDDEDGVTVDVPDAVDLEVEFESGPDGSSLEVELEWPTDAGVGGGAAGSTDHDSEPEVGGERDDEEAIEDGAADEGPPDVSVPRGIPSKAEFELYADRSGEWRWRLVHDNGNVIADSGESYVRKADARNGIESVRTNAGGADVVEQSE